MGNGPLPYKGGNHFLVANCAIKNYSDLHHKVTHYYFAYYWIYHIYSGNVYYKESVAHE